MYNDSCFVKRYLESLHKNIKVIKHPPKKYFLGSHHEKSVVIDQNVGYVGGIDLCYGRFERNGFYDLQEPREYSKYSNFLWIVI